MSGLEVIQNGEVTSVGLHVSPPILQIRFRQNLALKVHTKTRGHFMFVQVHNCPMLHLFYTTFKRNSLKMAVFWLVTPCRLVWVYQHFRDLYCLHQQGGAMMERAEASETSANSYQSTRRYNPEDGHLHTHRRENLKSYFNNAVDFVKQKKSSYENTI
jgi:hypothetical protein